VEHRRQHVRHADRQPALHRRALQHQVAVQQDDEERDERGAGAPVEERRGAAAQAAQRRPAQAHLAQGGDGARVAQRRLRQSAQALSLPQQAHRGPGQPHHPPLHEQPHGLQRERTRRQHQGQQAQQLARHLLPPPQQGQDHAAQDGAQGQGGQAQAARRAQACGQGAEAGEADSGSGGGHGGAQ